MSKVRIKLELSKEIAWKLEDYINRGLFTSKPEIISPHYEHYLVILRRKIFELKNWPR